MTHVAHPSDVPERRGFAPGLLVAAMAACFLAGAIGSAATLPAIDDWYAGLAKPWFTPPNAVFGPVWSVLYVMMGLVFWQILKAPDGAPRRRAILAFSVQLVLNALWSVAFFGLHSPLAGLAVIIPLWISIAWTIASTGPVAGRWDVLLVPYIAWVTYAAVLNGAIFLMNA